MPRRTKLNVVFKSTSLEVSLPSALRGPLEEEIPHLLVTESAIDTPAGSVTFIGKSRIPKQPSHSIIQVFDEFTIQNCGGQVFSVLDRKRPGLGVHVDIPGMRSRVFGNPDERRTYRYVRIGLDMLFCGMIQNRGYFLLHGAAVARRGAACIFLATSMGGKSTLTYHLLMDRENILLGDDLIICRPTQKGLRAWPYMRSIHCAVGLKLPNTSFLKRSRYGSYERPPKRVFLPHDEWTDLDSGWPANGMPVDTIALLSIWSEKGAFAERVHHKDGRSALASAMRVFERSERKCWGQLEEIRFSRLFIGKDMGRACQLIADEFFQNNDSGSVRINRGS